MAHHQPDQGGPGEVQEPTHRRPHRQRRRQHRREGGRRAGHRRVQRARLRRGGGGRHHALPHPQSLQANLLAGQHGQGGQEDHRARTA